MSDAGLLAESAVALAMAGRIEEALPGFRACMALAPAEGAYLVNLANGLIATRRHAAGAAWFQRSYAVRVADAESLMGLGIALNALGDFAPAAAAFARALVHDPASVTVLLGYGHSLVGLGRSAEALAVLKRSIVLEPAHPGAWKTLGTAWSSIDEAPRAIQGLRRCLAVGASDAELFAGLSRISRVIQDVAGSIVWGRIGLTLHAGDAGIRDALATSLLYLGETEEARNAFSRALAVDPSSQKGHSNLLFTLAYDESLSNERLFAAYRAWERRHAEPIYAMVRGHGARRDDRRRLRIGYVSAEFRDHPIAQLAEGILLHHDRRRFEIWGYAAMGNPDHVTRRLEAASDHWRSIVGISDAAAADLIRDDGIDILVMLGAHTGQNRPLILAHRPAPIQVTMHDLSTSGMRVVDAWLTDAVLHPPETTEGHTENLVRLPSLYLHRVPDRSPDVSPLPCLRSGVVTFGSFSIPAKLNDRVLRLWARVLAAVPGSRLVIGHNAAYADPRVAGRFRRHCREAGIPIDRLDLATDYVGRDGHLARVGSLDIALDPFPFNGGITTFEALWMGVPVVTLDGVRFAARGCASHLVQVGLDHLIAPSEQTYVEIAVGLAESPDALAELRGSLRQRVRSSLLCDAPAYVQALEQALLGLWSRQA
jgi:protein O-GlcNAc transferase